MDKFIEVFQNQQIEGQIFNEISQCNEGTKEYALKLYDEDIKQIIKTRDISLKKTGRIEFNGQIIKKLVEVFSDSPFIFQENYSETINELVEIFYNFKNETLDYIGDEEAIEIMKDKFDNYCNGSLELLEGKVLYKISDNIKNGVKDYANMDGEKEW